MYLFINVSYGYKLLIYMKKAEKILKIVMIASIVIAVVSLIAVLSTVVFKNTFYVEANNILITNQFIS